MLIANDTSRSIAAALSGNWKEAVALNLAIIKKTHKDTEAWNRLGRAYMELGLKTKAKEAYEKVLRLDKFNHIAAKNLELLKVAKAYKSSKKTSPTPVFLEEPGVTKTVQLARSGDPKITTRMHPGDEVTIVPRQHCVSIINNQGQNIGRLPDDLASRMQFFLKGGNTYAAWIKSVDQNVIKIFIKEMSRSIKLRNTPSFPLTEKLSYAAFTPPELIHSEKPDVSSTEEQDNPLVIETDSDDENALPLEIPTAADDE